MNMRVAAAAAVGAGLAAAAIAAAAGALVAASDAPPPDALLLPVVAKLGPGAGKEISGIVRSRRDPAVFWTLNDSGDEPRIYPVKADGTVVPAERYPETPGTLVGGAINGDWEDIALDASGRVVVADFGNNSNARADLTLYLVEEPEPTEGRTTYTSKILFRYPDQKARPAPRTDFNFDAEAIYTVGDEIHVLTKHRSDTFTKHYRLDARAPGVVNVLTYVGKFDIEGQATAADASDDGLKLAVLTYTHVWLFERRSLEESFFDGRVSRRAYRLDDAGNDTEALCFEDAGTLLLADEARGTLHRMPLTELREVRPARAGGGDGKGDGKGGPPASTPAGR